MPEDEFWSNPKMDSEECICLYPLNSCKICTCSCPCQERYLVASKHPPLSLSPLVTPMFFNLHRKAAEARRFQRLRPLPRPHEPQQSSQRHQLAKASTCHRTRHPPPRPWPGAEGLGKTPGSFCCVLFLFLCYSFSGPSKWGCWCAHVFHRQR